MKYVVFGLLAAIIISLGSGLFYLRREDADPSKLLNALKVRVALSLVLAQVGDRANVFEGVAQVLIAAR